MVITTCYLGLFLKLKTLPAAYQVVVQYRHWLTTEVYKLLLTVKKDATKSDSDMFYLH